MTSAAAMLLGNVDPKPAAAPATPAPASAPAQVRYHHPRHRHGPKPKFKPDAFEREPNGQDSAPIFGPGERVKTLKIHL